jgi:hypothetical protein
MQAEIPENIQMQIDALATGENANTNDLGPDYWALIWEVATAMADGLKCIALRIQVFVIPDIRETFEQSELVRKLEMGDEASGSGVLKGLTTMCTVFYKIDLSLIVF